MIDLRVFFYLSVCFFHPVSLSFSLSLSLRVDVNVKQEQDNVRPLHLACRYNSEKAAFYLVGHYANINIKDIKGRTPLHYATRKGHEKIIKVLYTHARAHVRTHARTH